MNSALKFALAASLATSAFAAPVSAVDVDSAAVEPIVEMDGGAISACGVVARFQPGTAIRFAVERRGKVADFVVRYWQGDLKSRSFRLDVDPQSLPELGPGQDLENGIELRAPARDPNVAVFIQQLMLQGVSVSTGDQFERKLVLRGPLPQSVRAAYLNCAGDLYRPEE